MRRIPDPFQCMLGGNSPSTSRHRLCFFQIMATTRRPHEVRVCGKSRSLSSLTLSAERFVFARRPSGIELTCKPHSMFTSHSRNSGVQRGRCKDLIRPRIRRLAPLCCFSSKQTDAWEPFRTTQDLTNVTYRFGLHSEA